MIDAELIRDAPRPLHAQISDSLHEKIATGEWPPHYKLPAEPELAEELGVSRGTVRRALQTLVQGGHLARVHGRGTFVLSASFEQPIGQELMSLAEALDRQGRHFTTEVLDARSMTPTPRIRALLDLAPTETVFYLRRQRRVASQIVAVLDNYVRYDANHQIAEHDYQQERLFSVIEQVHRQQVHSASRTFEAVAASEELAQLFGFAAGIPLLYLEQITYLADGAAVEYSDVWIRGDQLKVSSVLTRPLRVPNR